MCLLPSGLLLLFILLSSTAPLICSEPPTGSPAADAPIASQAKANAADLYRKAGNNLRPLSPEENTLVINALRNDLSNAATLPKDEAASLLALYTGPLKIIKEAAALPHCDWGHDCSKRMTISYAHARPLMTFNGLLCVQLRLQVKQGDFAEALSTAQRIVAIRQHLASERPLFAEVLFQASLNHLLRCTLANDLQAWPPSFLPALEQLFAPPSTAPFAKAIQTEAAAMRTLFEQTILPPLLKAPGSDPEEAKAFITAYLNDSEKIEALLALPATEALPQAEALRESFKKNEEQSPLTALVLGDITGLVEINANNNTYNAIFQTAIAVRLHGPEGVKRSRDPFNEKPFGYEKTDTGFTLTSELLDKNKPIFLTFPKKP